MSIHKQQDHAIRRFVFSFCIAATVGMMMTTALATSSHAEDESDAVREQPRTTQQRAGRIGVSPSGHYVTYKGKTLMLIADSGTHCVLQNVNLDHRRWIDAWADRGIRAFHVWSFMPPRQKQDGSVIEARYGYVYPGVTPWARKTSGPSATDGLKQWDLTAFDDGRDGDFTHYWPRLRDLCSYAKGKSIVVGITAFFGFPKHNRPERPLWSYHPFNAANGGPVADHGPLITQAQIIDTPATEIWMQTWSDGWSTAKKTQWIWERFAKKLIDDTSAFGNVFFIYMDEHSYSEGNMGDHFRNFFRKRGTLWMDWGRRRKSVDMVYDQFLMRPGNDRRLRAQFAKKPVRPFFGLEEGGASGFNYTSDLLGMVWRYSIAGGHYFHHSDERQETVTTGIMVYDPKTKPFGRKDKVLQRLDWLGHASRFFNQTIQNLDAMTPHNELIGSTKGVYCLANPGVEYAVYSRTGKSFELDLSAVAGKTVSTRFYDPRTGQWTDELQVAGGNKNVFRKPDGEDWVFYARVK